MNIQKDPHVVIIGAGFGGLEAARRLANTPVQITVIDRHNYHLFQPLLYQVAIAGLVPSQIAYPLRTIFRRQKNVNFQMEEVSSIDFNSRYVKPMVPWLLMIILSWPWVDKPISLACTPWRTVASN